MVKLLTYELSYFLRKQFFGDEVIIICLFISQHLVHYNYKGTD